MRRRAAAEAARKRREELAGGKPRRRGLRTAPRCSRPLVLSPRSPSAPGTATARSGSSAPTTPAASPSTAALPYELPFGIELYDERYASPIQTESLPPRRRDAVTGHDLRSREDAVSLIEDIQKSQGVP